MTDRKLYRVRQNRMLGGVCAGLGEYLGVDPTVVRVVFLITLFFGGAGALAYLVLWLIIPEEPTATPGQSTGSDGPGNPPPTV